jgi:hypothetical protein
MNADQFDAEENAATDAIIMQIPQTKLEEIAGWFLYYASQEGIVNYQTIADDNTSEIKKEIMQRLQEIKKYLSVGKHVRL